MQTFFDSALEAEFNKIYKKLKELERKDDDEYQSDLSFLLDHFRIFEPLDTTCKREDFSVSAVDGSGASDLIKLNNISVHLITAGFSADLTDFKKGTTIELDIRPEISTYPNGVTKLVLIREDEELEVWEEIINFVRDNYGKEPKEIVFDVLRNMFLRKMENEGKDISKIKIKNTFELLQQAKLAGFTLYNKPIDKFHEWMISPRPQTGWYDQFREILEYSLAYSILKTEKQIKYLFIDGSMNMLISRNHNQPRLISNYLLRDLCTEALKRKTCVVAVSKTTTFPFIYKIAQDVRIHLKGEKKWFFRVPSKELGETPLRLLEGKSIPPENAITYLFHFSAELPVLRIDFDLEWWKKNIHSENQEKEKEREIELFKEIDWLSRDVRYHGYLFDLAFSHFNALITFKERDLIADRLIDFFTEKGEDPRRYIHPRKRLGLM
ncbi:MAG: hypothetical protein ACTSVB_08305 [Candidatus Heimdallarchaeaceae archaeon]